MITGGSVVIEDGKKGAEQFDPARKVKVELHFSVPEEAQAQAEHAIAWLDNVSNLAQAKVDELIKKTKISAAVIANVAQAPVKAAGAVKAEEATKPVVEAAPANPTVVAAPASTSLPGVATKDPGVAAATVISDQDLYKRTTEVQSKTKSAGKITALVKKHTADLPKERQRVTFIPQENRQAYLDDLQALADSVATPT